jgi:diketogulonate reductase-like aldo/keto reductase
LFVVTKVWCTEFGPEHVIPSVRTSLEKLGTGYLDAVLLHWPFQLVHGTSFPPRSEDVIGFGEGVFKAWNELEKAKAEGLVRSIGVSNFTAKKIEALIAAGGSVPSINQVEMHPALSQPKLVEYSKRRGIVLTAYSPLGSPGRPERLRKEGAPAPLEATPVLDAAKAHGKTPAQVLIRWCIQRGVVCIPKSVTASRVVANGQVFDFHLTAEEMASIDSLNQGSEGRLISGAFFAKEGQSPADLWDGEPEAVVIVE